MHFIQTKMIFYCNRISFIQPTFWIHKYCSKLSKNLYMYIWEIIICEKLIIMRSTYVWKNVLYMLKQEKKDNKIDKRYK